jgi:hypothetical protein
MTPDLINVLAAGARTMRSDLYLVLDIENDYWSISSIVLPPIQNRAIAKLDRNNLKHSIACEAVRLKSIQKTNA